METSGDATKGPERTHRRPMLVVVSVVLALAALLATRLATSGTAAPLVHRAGSNAAHATGPSPPLTAVSCPTPTECVAVGGKGRVLVGYGSSSPWAPVSVPTDHYLFGIACPTSSRCVAVGDAGTVLLSQQGGHGWHRVKSGTQVPLSAVACQDPDTCVAVGDGGVILVSRDGGARWEPTNRGTQVIDAATCDLPDECVAVTTSADEVLRTTGGTAWSAADVAGGPLLALLPMNGVACSSPTCVSVGAHGLISFSSDDGASWAFDGAPVTQRTLNAVSCATRDACVAVGDEGTVLATADGGRSWTPVASATSETLLGVECQTTGSCVAVGDSGTIVSTQAGNQPWEEQAGAAVPNAAPLTVLVVGDSFAHTVALYVGREASSFGVDLVDGGIDGCSLARGDTLSLPAGGPCAASGPGWAAVYQQDLAQYRPDLVLLVLGPWDLSARLIGGQWLSPGQPAYDTYYAGQLMSAIRILAGAGARVAVATVPYVRMLGPETCAPPPATVPACPTESERVGALDQVARQVAAQLPGGVTLIDLGSHLSPNGRFTQTVNGVVVRAADGVHLSESGGEWLAPWLVPQLVAAERAGT